MGTGLSGARRQPFLGQGICNQHQSTKKKINHQLQSSASWKVVPLRCHCQRYRWWRWPKSIDILEMEDNPPQNGKANLTGQRLGYRALPKKSCEIWVYSPQKCINIWMSTNNYQLFLVFDTVSTQIYPDLPISTKSYCRHLPNYSQRLKLQR